MTTPISPPRTTSPGLSPSQISSHNSPDPITNPNNKNEAPTTLKIATLNCKGLNTPVKRRIACHDLLATGAQILILTETHLIRQMEPKYWHKNIDRKFFSSAKDKKTKGAGVLIHRNCPLQIKGHHTDTEGRILLINGTLPNTEITLVAIYAPNEKQAEFFRQVDRTITQHMSGELIVAGDFNSVLIPSLDKSKHRSSTIPTATKSLRSLIKSQSLLDTWRTLNPDSKDYTYYSTPHDSYSRIDVILTSNSLIELLSDTKIIPCSWSDHEIMLSAFTLHTIRSIGEWKLNEWLLNFNPVIQELSQSIPQYFSDNQNGEVSEEIVWAAHKPVIRGILIKHATHIRKQQFTKIKNLTAEILSLETSHKLNHDSNTLTSLINKKGKLKQILIEKAEKSLRNSNRLFTKKETKQTPY
uniref:exodeoxyribonuclease III n=1 Tax=Xenopus tropicalis TaxID=8364 RepID=A0A803J7G8_XENTR